MSKYKPYPKYKESGVAWLGEVPEGWIVLPIKYLIQDKRGSIKTGPFGSHLKNSDMKIKGTTKVINQKNVISKNLELVNHFINSKKSEELQSFKIYQNDLLITTRGTIGRTLIVEKDIGKAILHPCLLRLQIEERKVLNELISLLIQDSHYVLEQILVKSNATTIEVIYSDSLLNIDIVIPPTIKEQSILLKFLTQKTKKIDTLIKKQQTLIELLKEKRQALISHVVTKGLDDSVAMKSSGVAWLGDVPEGWEVVSLKYISKITLGKMLTPTDKGNMTLKPYLKAKNLKWFNVNVNEIDKMWFSKNELKSLRLKKDDLLVSEGGEVGRTCIWNDELDECYIQNSVNRVQFSKHNARFFLYQFFSAGQFGYFDSIVNKISIAHLTKEKLGDVKFVKVSLNEQTKIVNHLDKKTKQIDTLIEKSTKAIELLKERRVALVSAVVTGKVDVRNESL